MRSHCYTGVVPRQVDTEQHERQKAEIARAVWRLAARAGLESVSLREVAAEAGVSMGRVQHYFGTKDEMLLFGLRLAQQRMEARVVRHLERLPGPADAEDVLRAALEEMLGDDHDTRQAIRVSVAYLPRALEDPRVAEVLFADDAELRAHAADVVRAAQADHRASPELDADREARIMWSLASSLGTEVAFGQTPVRDARTALLYYLDRTLGRRSPPRRL